MRVTGAAASDHAGLAALAERAVAAGVALAHVAPALLLVARIDYDHGRLEAGLAVAHRVLELAGEASPWAPEAILLEARRAFVLGEFAPSLPLWERGRDAAIAAGDAEMEAIARLNHALTRVRLGERDGVEAEVERAHALLVGVGAHHQLPIQRGYAFNVATALGDREGARASLVDGLRVAREVGSARDEIGFGVYLALVELDASRFAPAAVAAEAAFRRAILAHEHLAGHSARLAAQIAVERGELDTARQWTDECRALLRVTGREIDGALAEAVEVARRALAGDVAGARTLARSVDAATLGADNGVAIAARGVASVALAAEALAARRAGADAAADALSPRSTPRRPASATRAARATTRGAPSRWSRAPSAPPVATTASSAWRRIGAPSASGAARSRISRRSPPWRGSSRPCSRRASTAAAPRSTSPSSPRRAGPASACSTPRATTGSM
ncbi:MAG: hypothetical protein H6745_33140 [Deltaproteobacteria bacterium]|nr:hypothetical protein [Deltaproteobacteria bacterium]